MSAGPTRRVLLYADVNLNVIDGSSVWLVSMAQALAGAGCAVDVLLKAPSATDRLAGALAAAKGVRLQQPWTRPPRGRRVPEALTPAAAAARAGDLDAEGRYDAVVCRGMAACLAFAVAGRFEGRLWPYVTDAPQRSAAMTGEVRATLASIARSARRVFAQTEDARAFLEHHVPEAAGRVVLLPPMIPTGVPVAEPSSATADGPLRLVYAGKLARDWRTLEMCELPAQAAEVGVDVTVTMIGDKIHPESSRPGWASRMRQALEAPGVRWLGGMSREDTLAEVARHDVGLSWRASSLDASHELSTKVLEYAAAGVPPLLNRTAAHEDLLGVDYPLFVDDESVLDVLCTVARDRQVLATARARGTAVAGAFTIPAAAERLAEALASNDPITVGTSARRTRVLVASHDLKFAGDVVDLLERRTDVAVSFDHWTSLHQHDVGRSRELLADADVVLCEWAGPNAVWYSANVRPEQRLVVRLHAFELRGPWLPRIETAAVDAWVCVSDAYAQRARAVLDLDPTRVVVVPNTVDVTDLHRDKVPGAELRLGMVGFVPLLKRLDRALDVMERLAVADDRFTLHLRGRLPNEYPWEWRKPVVRAHYDQQLARLDRAPLRGRVTLEPFGADVASWLRKVGWVLSPSTQESFHLAPVEGMASGAVPVVWEREGAVEVFGSRWLHSDADAAARHVLDVVRGGRWHEESAAARGHAARYDAELHHAAWARVLGFSA